MRRLLIRGLAALLTAAGLILTGQGPAAADPVCQRTHPATGQCLIWVTAPPSSGTGGVEDAGEPVATGPGTGCVWTASDGSPPQPTPCSTAAGYWSNSHNCYLSAADPQPPPGAAYWEGAYQETGTVYECFQPQTDTLTMLWLVAPPAAAAVGPTPGEVAQMAVEQMDLSAIDIGIVPAPGPDSVGLVGMPVWMWAADPDDRTYGPATASASAGGITVTATASVHQIIWDMGDGATVVCRTPGTPYRPGFGRRESPDCGHVYDRSSAQQSRGTYTVTATSDWVVTWSGAGQSGTIRLDGLTRSVAITVGEAQVLVQ